MGVVRAYSVDIRRLSLGELWRISPGAGFLVAAACKVFSVPLPMATRVPVLDSLDLLKPGDIPSDAAVAMGSLVQAWEGMGFVRSFDYTVPPVSSGMRGYATALLSSDRMTMAEVVFVEKVAGPVSRREVVSWCMSCLPDGSRVGATSSRRRMNGPPQFRMTYLTGKTPGALHAAHRALLESLRGSAPVPLDSNRMRDLLVENNNLAAEHLARRGVYVLAGGGAPTPIQPR